MKTDTFGNNPADKVLAEHLTAHPEQAAWCCRAISKATKLLSSHRLADIKDKEFRSTVYYFIKCSVLKHVSNPPAHIDEKAASYTANIVSRHLIQYYHDHVQSKKARKKELRRAKEQSALATVSKS